MFKEEEHLARKLCTVGEAWLQGTALRNIRNHLDGATVVSVGGDGTPILTRKRFGARVDDHETVVREGGKKHEWFLQRGFVFDGDAAWETRARSSYGGPHAAGTWTRRLVHVR